MRPNVHHKTAQYDRLDYHIEDESAEGNKACYEKEIFQGETVNNEKFCRKKTISYICIGLATPIRWTGVSPVGKGLKRNLNSLSHLRMSLECRILLSLMRKRESGTLFSYYIQRWKN